MPQDIFAMNSGRLVFGAALCVAICACAHAEPSAQRVEAVERVGASGLQAGTGDAGVESPRSRTPTNKKARNSAALLIEHAMRIERVELVHRDTGELVGALDKAALDALRRAIAGSEPHTDLTATSPRWPVWVRIYLSGRDEPYLGVPHGQGRLRFDSSPSALSSEPIHRDGGLDPRVREVDIGEPNMGAIEQSMGGDVPLNREYRSAPGRLDLSDYRAE